MARGKPVHQKPIGDQTTFESWFAVVALIYLLICGVGMIGTGFKIATGESARELFALATNPILGLFIGLTATALMQSSSTVTAIIVGITAGGLPVSVAVPMIMGANIGTTITNTIVSLGHVRKRKAFRRAFAAATVHDQFNLLSVLIFLPLEIAFGMLEKSGRFLANLLVGEAWVDVDRVNFLHAAIQPVIEILKAASASLPHRAGGIVLIFVGVALLFLSVTFLSRMMAQLMVGKAQRILHGMIGRGPFSSIGLGALITAVVQSSSTTTSLVVPLAGSGVFTLRQVYWFTLGANVGTCVTALLAATTVGGARAFFALQIALIHLLYNLIGIVVIFGTPFLRDIPVACADWLARSAAHNRAYVLAYIGGVFFVLPGICIFVGNLF